MSTISLSEFNNTTKEEWLKQTTKDLKGKDFDETLVWKLQEGFNIQPYYSSEDLDETKISLIQEAQNTKRETGWQNRSKIVFSNEKDDNALIIKLIKSGVDAIEIDLSHVNVSEVSFVKLLHNIKLSETPIFFQTNQPEEVLTELQKFINYQLKGGLQNDFVANYLTGKTDSIDDSTWESTKVSLEKTYNYTNFSVLSIESHPFHQAGADFVQELAFTLNSAVLYVDKLTDLGVKIEDILPKIEFSVSIGTNYFFEIAKLRALRFLWNKIVKTYSSSLDPRTSIHCQTSYFYDAAATPNTNMLRATTEAMSAVIGGCDALSIHPYNEIFEQPNEFSTRIAKNISVLLKEESYLDKTKDASSGSYYIESLTIQLAESAWKLFTEVEEKGGLLSAFESGFIRAEIDKSFEAKVAALQNGKVMVGVNKFRFDEKPIEIQKNQANESSKILPNRRIAEVFE